MDLDPLSHELTPNVLSPGRWIFYINFPSWGNFWFALGLCYSHVFAPQVILDLPTPVMFTRP